jgi:hypothetical protein
MRRKDEECAKQLADANYWLIAATLSRNNMAELHAKVHCEK